MQHEGVARDRLVFCQMVAFGLDRLLLLSSDVAGKLEWQSRTLRAGVSMLRTVCAKTLSDCLGTRSRLRLHVGFGLIKSRGTVVPPIT